MNSRANICVEICDLLGSVGLLHHNNFYYEAALFHLVWRIVNGDIFIAIVGCCGPWIPHGIRLYNITLLRYIVQLLSVRLSWAFQGFHSHLQLSVASFHTGWLGAFCIKKGTHPKSNEGDLTGVILHHSNLRSMIRLPVHQAPGPVWTGYLVHIWHSTRWL